MKFIQLIFLLLLFMLHDLHSQGGFRKKYFLDKSLNSSSYDAFETPDGSFIITGIIVDSLNNIAYTKLSVVGTDKNGVFLWRKDYGTFNFEYRDIWQGGKVTISDSGGFYQTLCVKDYLTNKENAVLIRFSFNGDTLWQKVFEADTTERLYPFGLTKSIDGGFLISGICINYGVTKSQTCLLIKVGKDGQELWRKKISKNVPNTQAGFSSVQDSATKRIIIVGYQYIGTSTSAANYSSILILDSLGNKIMQKSYNNAGGGAFGDIIQLKDGNFLSGGQWCVDYDKSIYQAFLVKFDVDGNMIWNKRYGSSGQSNVAGYFHELTNGDIVFFARIDTAITLVKLQIFQADGNGNIKWQRYFGKKTPGHAESCMSMKPTKDKGFVFATRNLFDAPPTPFTMVKVDSTGCDTTEAYCKSIEVGLEENFTNNGFGFRVYPNPASSQITVATGSGGVLDLTITDVSGRLLKSVAFEEVYELDVSDLAPGIYFFTLVHEGKALEVMKVVVAR